MKWLEQIKKVSPGIPVAVIGNKADKFKNLQQSESVKIRECNLQTTYGCKKVKNFLISIKEDKHIHFTDSFWSTNINIEEKKGCLIGLEYLLQNLLDPSIVIKY